MGCGVPEGAMKLANSFCDNAPGLFQVWYIRALFIKQQDLILSIEVTSYTSAGQPVRHGAESGGVYMDFDTAMEIIVVALSAYESSGSNTQIMMRVVSLEEELLDVHKECQLKSVMCTLRLVTAGARWPLLLEPAGPSSTSTSKLLLADFCLACDHCRDCSGPSLDFPALSRRKSPWTLASSFLMT